MADAARAAILPYFRAPDLDTQNKDAAGFDPVTIADRAAALGIEAERLYFDPLIRPLSSNPEQVGAVLTALGEIKNAVKGSKTICGLSNISFGLPKRRLLNSSFLVMAIGAGLDGAILDPTEPGIVGLGLGAEALAGRDEYCMNYISAERSGLLR